MIVHFVITIDIQDINDMTEDQLKYMFMQSALGFEYDESDITVHVRPDDKDEYMCSPWELDSPESL